MSPDRPASTSTAARLRSAPLVAAVAGAGLLMPAFWFQPAAAQAVQVAAAAEDVRDLFAPVVDGDPDDARFESGKPARRRDGRSSFGEIGTGSQPPAPAAAGTTGFVSTTARRPPRPGARNAATVRRVTTVSTPTVAVRPAPDGARRGASRDPSAVSPPQVPTIATPTRRRPPAETDPFEPTGIRAGAFTLWPAIELSGGHDSNPPRSSAPRSSAIFVVAPELKVKSDWQRHSLTADLRGTYTDYAQTFGCCNADGSPTGTPNSLDRPSFDGKVNGRIDASSHDRFDVEGRLLVGTDNPGSPNVQLGLPRDLEKLPIYTMFGGSLGYAHRFNRFELAAKAGADRRVYQSSLLIDGSRSSNDDRDYNQFAGTLRGSYDLLPGVKPFVEVGVDTRVHDLEYDRNNIRRDSDGMTVRAGTTFEFSRKLTGEISAGYLGRSYKDPSLQNISGLAFDSTLIWSATPLTTLTLTAKSTVDEMIVPGVSGVLRRDFGVGVDHAFRRWLIGSAKLGYGLDDYVGLEREDQRYFASLGLTYKLNRNMQLKGEYRHEWQTSSVPGAEYVADMVTLGLRLQR